MDNVGSSPCFFNGRQRAEGNLLGIFAKEPVAGSVKTRLSPPLGLDESAELYRVCLEEIVERVAASGYRAVIFYEGRKAYFRAAFPQATLRAQEGGCLGERMDRALNFLLSQEKKAALIGSDTPDLPMALVDGAFSQLERNHFVSVPSEDGGYVLVGAKKPLPDMFRDIPWSTDGVLEATRRRAAELGIHYRETGRWEDVDDLSSLKRLVGRSPYTAAARHAINFLGKYL